MQRQMGSLAEATAVFVSATLAGMACCVPIVIQWLGFLVFLAGGQVLFMWLAHYEIPISLVITAAALLGMRLAPDRLTRRANALLAGVALLLAALRAAWEVQRGAVMAVEPVYQLFIYRQTALLVAASLVLAVRLGLLIKALRPRKRSGNACPMPVSGQAGTRPTWN